MSDRRYYVTQTRLAAIGWQTVLIENAVKGEPPDRDTAAWALRTIRDVLMALVVEAAKRIDTRAHLAVLLGGEAGLRAGEIMALERRDLDFVKG